MKDLQDKLIDKFLANPAPAMTILMIIALVLYLGAGK